MTGYADTILGGGGRYINDYKLPAAVFRLVYTATASSGARVRNFSLHRSFVNNIALYYDATYVVNVRYDSPVLSTKRDFVKPFCSFVFLRAQDTVFCY